MKKILAFFACFSFLTSFAVSSGQEDYYSYSFARLSYVKGDVFIQRAKDLGNEEGTVNLPVVEGDKLGTREGRAEIHFGRKNYLRISSNTQIDFIELPRKGDDKIKLHLLSGNIYLRISFLEAEKDFEIHTPDASFYILEEGLYRFDVRENKETELFVYEGSVEAAGEEGSAIVKSEEKMMILDGHFISDPDNFFAGSGDSFSQWNRSRDALHTQAVTQRYLPDELYEYEEELADNGRWIYEQPYGYVWTPYRVYSDWRPYYNGRWIWYPVIGWNWVSYDPWGWSVHHYGRWHWRLGLGWYWIPNRIWSPGWVHWYRGYNHIGWSPLSYYGYPGVIINNSFYGRYNNSHYPLNSRALTVIHRNQLHARRISKVALSQNKIRKLGKISLSAKQPLRSALKRTFLNSKTADKVLSRANVRRVQRSYGSRKTISSRSKLTPSRKSSRILNGSLSGKERRNTAERPAKINSSRISSRTITGYRSRLPQQRTQTSRQSSSVNSTRYSSKSSMKSYPSRNTRSSSRSRTVSSSKQMKSFPSRVLKSGSRSSNSSKAVSSRSKVKTNSRSRRSSPTVKSRVPSSRKSKSSYTTRSVRSGASKARRSVRPRSSGSSSSSSKYRSSSSRSSSSRSSKVSSSKSRSSRSSKSSSSRTKTSRSSKRSSSSRSSSKKKK